jgi:hypothetical protein
VGIRNRYYHPNDTDHGLPVQLTIAITWSQGVLGEEDGQAEAAQVNGGVREWQECRVQEAVTPLRSPSPLHLVKSAE